MCSFSNYCTQKCIAHLLLKNLLIHIFVYDYWSTFSPKYCAFSLLIYVQYCRSIFTSLVIMLIYYTCSCLPVLVLVFPYKYCILNTVNYLVICHVYMSKHLRYYVLIYKYTHFYNDATWLLFSYKTKVFIFVYLIQSYIFVYIFLYYTRLVNKIFS